MEKLFQSLQPLYQQQWFPYALGVVGLLFAYSVLMTLKSLPKLIMYPIVMATCVILVFHWTYHRNEPEFMSPLIDMLAPWLPTNRA